MTTPVIISGAIGLILMIAAIALMIRFSPRAHFPGWRIILVVVFLVAVGVAVALSLAGGNSGGRP
ncbi:MAG TPA: hypothetical protein VJ183_09770 [Chloroflexia bacterium]|nr:hypothetical protein [Chloroflexia bacterium]